MFCFVFPPESLRMEEKNEREMREEENKDLVHIRNDGSKSNFIFKICVTSETVSSTKGLFCVRQCRGPRDNIVSTVCTVWVSQSCSVGWRKDFIP